MRMRNRATLFLAAMSMVALATGCSSTQKDQALATDIKAKMFSDPQVKGANVDVAVKNGEAILSGEVPNDGARYEAFKIASETPGVKHVTDKMVMQSAQAMPATEPAPVEAPPVEPPPVKKPRPPKHVHKETRHQVDSNTSSMKASSPDPTPVPPPPAAMPPQQPVTAEAPPPPPPPQPKRVEIPAGTPVRVQMIDSVDSSVNRAGEVFRDPPGLGFRHGHEGAKWLHEPDERQVGDVGWEHLMKEIDTVVDGVDDVGVEEREAHVVAGAVHHGVRIHLRPVGEAHAVAGQRCDVRLGNDSTHPDALHDPLADRRMRLPEAMIRLG